MAQPVYHLTPSFMILCHFFSLGRVTGEEIKNIIKSFKVASSGCDDAITKVIKESSIETYPFLKFIIG